jgi:hypothetical protein
MIHVRADQLQPGDVWNSGHKNYDDVVIVSLVDPHPQEVGYVRMTGRTEHHGVQHWTFKADYQLAITPHELPTRAELDSLELDS